MLAAAKEEKGILKTIICLLCLHNIQLWPVIDKKALQQGPEICFTTVFKTDLSL